MIAIPYLLAFVPSPSALRGLRVLCGAVVSCQFPVPGSPLRIGVNLRNLRMKIGCQFPVGDPRPSVESVSTKKGPAGGVGKIWAGAARWEFTIGAGAFTIGGLSPWTFDICV